MLYAPSVYGVHRFYETEIGGGLIALYSLYGEPAHLAAIFCAGLFIGTYKNASTGEGLKLVHPVSAALILIASLLTGSATVYLSLALTMITIILIARFDNRIKIVLVASLMLFFVEFFAIKGMRDGSYADIILCKKDI